MPADPAPLFTILHGLRLILASASPRRQEFLSGLGLKFSISPAPAEPVAGANGRERASLAARAKALAVAAHFPGHVIIGADTTVEVDGKILGKPSGHEEAFSMLLALNGKTCSVASAASVLLPAVREIEITDTAAVTFAHWPEDVLAAYARDSEPLDKAGAFAIQGRGAFLIERVKGSFTTVMGLPGAGLVSALLNHGVIGPA